MRKEKVSILRVPLKLSKGILFLGDLHVESSALKECLEIAKEIAEQSEKADILIQLGDLCDKNKLNSEELYNLTLITNIWKKAFNEVHIVQGNHDRLDSNYSIIDYLNLLNVNIYPDDVCFYFKNTLIRCGHYFVDKSESSFGHFRYTLDDFKLGYSYGLLGHQHDFQTLTNNICHLGSARFVAFSVRTKHSTNVTLYCLITVWSLFLLNLLLIWLMFPTYLRWK